MSQYNQVVFSGSGEGWMPGRPVMLPLREAGEEISRAVSEKSDGGSFLLALLPFSGPEAAESNSTLAGGCRLVMKADGQRLIDL
jgi:hypothetical protein